MHCADQFLSYVVLLSLPPGTAQLLLLDLHGDPGDVPANLVLLLHLGLGVGGSSPQGLQFTATVLKEKPRFCKARLAPFNVASVVTR